MIEDLEIEEDVMILIVKMIEEIMITTKEIKVRNIIKTNSITNKVVEVEEMKEEVEIIEVEKTMTGIGMEKI